MTNIKLTTLGGVRENGKNMYIAESQIYQNLKQIVKEQEMMALGTMQEIYDFLMAKQKEAEIIYLSFFVVSYNF